MDRVNRKWLFVELVLLAVMLLIEWKLQLRRLYFARCIGEVLILTAVLKIMPLLELSVNDLIGAAVFLVLDRVLLQSLYYYDSAIPLIFLLSLELLGLTRGLHHRKSGYGITIGYAVLCCLAVLCIYQKWVQIILTLFYEREGEFGFVVKALYLLICMVIMAIPVFLILHCLNGFIKKWLIRLREYSITYGEIDRSVMLVILLTLGALSMRELVGILIPFLPENQEIHMIFFSVAENTYEIPLLWTGFSIMLVLIQVIYIRLLVKSISVKEEMRIQEKDLHQLAEYNHELEQNMEDMRGIRHDIKNMFLTMGGFVDRSDDEEMKAFYEENIVPFAKRELQKNDLYVKLACIHNESLKSFLYYKVMQGIEQKVSVDLSVQLADMSDFLCMQQSDLIRILGILIDNAVEEARVCKGTVVISIKEKEKEYLFSVSNTVRQQVKEKGVIAGTTDKGLGRGNGLLIVDKLVRKYRNVLLNSYFKEDAFVQCLRIKK